MATVRLPKGFDWRHWVERYDRMPQREGGATNAPKGRPLRRVAWPDAKRLAMLAK
jgi:hypothetical protein